MSSGAGSGSSRSSTTLTALLWGFAEATFFFIVPDVIVTYVGLRSGRRATLVALWAVAGAVVGGAVMWWFGANHPDVVFPVIEWIPAISTSMVESVVAQTEELGLAAVLTGPLRGTPYKIYAAQWGAAGGGLLPFLLMSIPARLPRFLLAGLATRGIARMGSRLVGPDSPRARWILGAAWVAFYSVYFLVRDW